MGWVNPSTLTLLLTVLGFCTSGVVGAAVFAVDGALEVEEALEVGEALEVEGALDVVV